MFTKQQDKLHLFNDLQAPLQLYQLFKCAIPFKIITYKSFPP